MRVIVIIPARYGSTRFPGKPLARIMGKPMIQWVYENVKKVEMISTIYVATDDQRIYDTVQRFGGKVMMTLPEHSCGSDRIAECLQRLNISDDTIVLNIQGDEPLICKEMIEELIRCFDDSKVYMGTLKKLITDDDELVNPNIVKVITDRNDDAIYFSRYAIPYEKEKTKSEHYKHIGVYGYTAKFLLQFCKLPKARLEKAESLEQLRAIENGYKIRVKESEYQTIGVDTPEQVELVERMLQEGIGNE